MERPIRVASENNRFQYGKQFADRTKYPTPLPSSNMRNRLPLPRPAGQKTNNPPRRHQRSQRTMEATTNIPNTSKIQHPHRNQHGIRCTDAVLPERVSLFRYAKRGTPR